MRIKNGTPAGQNRGPKDEQGLGCVAEKQDTNSPYGSQLGGFGLKLVYIAPWIPHREDYYRHAEKYAELTHEQMLLEFRLADLEKERAAEEAAMDECRRRMIEANGGEVP